MQAALKFTAKEPFVAKKGPMDDGELLPPGYIVTCPEPRLFRKAGLIDSVKLEKALCSGFSRMGLDNPDICRTQEGVWINAGTVDRIKPVVDAKEIKDSHQPSPAYQQFAEGFLSVTDPKKQAIK